MKFRMLSVLSIVLVLMVKSMDISARDYTNLRILANAIPVDPLLFPYPLETQFDTVVYQLAQSDGFMERFNGESDTVAPTFEAYEKLKTIATEEQLNELLLHESPVVKVYAYRALIVNQMNMNCEYELDLLEDSTCIDWFADNQLTSTTVADLVQQPYYE